MSQSGHEPVHVCLALQTEGAPFAALRMTFYVNYNRLLHSVTIFRSVSVAWPAQKFLGGKMLDFRQITLFYLEKRLSKHKMTIFSKTLGEPWPLWLRLCSVSYSTSVIALC